MIRMRQTNWCIEKTYVLLVFCHRQSNVLGMKRRNVKNEIILNWKQCGSSQPWASLVLENDHARATVSICNTRCKAHSLLFDVVAIIALCWCKLELAACWATAPPPLPSRQTAPTSWSSPPLCCYPHEKCCATRD